MIEAFHTFDDGTLVDFALGDDKRLTIRAGRSVTPSERPIVLTLTPRDVLMFVTILHDVYYTKPFTCKFCGRPSNIDPADQTRPPDYCHPADHGDTE